MNIKPNELKGLIELLKEASYTFERFEVEVEGEPNCYCYPLKDELYGYAVMLEENSL